MVDGWLPRDSGRAAVAKLDRVGSLGCRGARAGSSPRLGCNEASLLEPRDLEQALNCVHF